MFKNIFNEWTKAQTEVPEDLEEKKLKGDQHELDTDKDGDIDAKDFKNLRTKNKKKKKDKDEGDIEMNPKMDKGAPTEQKESRIRTALKSVLSEKSPTAGATKPETMDD